jgi:DNA topoisomerase-1
LKEVQHLLEETGKPARRGFGAKKTVAKKVAAPKKTAAKKTAVKKTATKKAATKKVAAKKTVITAPEPAKSLLTSSSRPIEAGKKRVVKKS